MQQSGKHSAFRHILNSSVAMYERSGMQFFVTIAGIQLGPRAFDESRLVIRNLGLTRILGSFRLVLERKAGK